MILYRPFQNSDPPGIAEIWRSQPPANALMQPMTPAVLDDTVFAKPYFDRDGLIVAIEDNKLVGFVHAGFGPNESQTELDYSQGTTAMLLVLPREDRQTIAHELLARSEAYLQSRGATSMFGGATQDLAPFYFGLYGGSLLSGVMASDHEGGEVFRSAGYVESTYATVMRRDLAAYRPPIDRELMQVRRQYQIVKQTETLAESWWEASAFAAIERAEFVLLPKASGLPAAAAKYWDVQPLSGAWGVRAAGIVSLDVAEQPNACKSAIATHFISETLKQVQSFGMTLAEFHVRTDDSLLSDVCAKLAFDESDQGLLFKKEIS